MRVIKCEPMTRAYVTEIGDGLKAMQDTVGGYIQAVYPYEDEVAIICNEEGKLMDLPFNRIIDEMQDIISGTFFICGLGEEDFTDIPKDLEEKYIEIMDGNMVLVVRG